MTTIEVKLDTVMNKLGSNERRMHTTHEMGDELKSHLFLVHFSVLFSVKIE